ncbi:hypothetical protein F511_21091 [Dorcoceras hygrometricum]|uniref:Uncharacterized protein n=1 Tax=Dorcoceras hygrometricum TaxID=472368 RepID=A0A2Z7AD77_9LAMI|nr:hypothetical protein F511_21091 [Dorcoceras hygrometricum]
MAWTAFRHTCALNNMSRAMYTCSIDVHPLLMKAPRDGPPPAAPPPQNLAAAARATSAHRAPSGEPASHFMPAIVAPQRQQASTSSAHDLQQRPANVQPPSSQARGKQRTTAQRSRNQRRPYCRPACGQRAQHRARGVERPLHNTAQHLRRGVAASAGNCKFIAHGRLRASARGGAPPCAAAP